MGAGINTKAKPEGRWFCESRRLGKDLIVGKEVCPVLGYTVFHGGYSCRGEGSMQKVIFIIHRGDPAI